MPVIYNSKDYSACSTDQSRAEMLAIIQSFIEKNGYSPSYRQIAENMKYHKSTSSIKQIMDDCKKKGLINYVPGIARTCSLTAKGKKFVIDQNKKK